MYRVVIADGDPMVRYINRSLVEENNSFRVVEEFSGGRETLAYLSKNPVDLLILDICLPGCNGLDLLREIRTRRIDTDVIMVTAADDSKSLAAALRLGVIDYLVKPYKPARFQQTLAKYIRYMEGLGADARTGMLVMDYALHAVPVDTKGVQDETLERILTQFEKSTRGRSVEEIAESAELSRVTVRRYMKYLLDTGRVTSSINYNTGGRPCLIYHLNR